MPLHNGTKTLFFGPKIWDLIPFEIKKFETIFILF